MAPTILLHSPTIVASSTLIALLVIPIEVPFSLSPTATVIAPPHLVVVWVLSLLVAPVVSSALLSTSSAEVPADFVLSPLLLMC